MSLALPRPNGYAARGCRCASISGNVDRNELNGSRVALHDLAADGLRAAIVSLDYPSALSVGETGEVTLVLENLGARTWSGGTRLGTTMPRDRDSALATVAWLSAQRPTAVPLDVATGDTVTLTFDIRAPDEAGQYTEHFNLVEEDFAWFSDTPPGGEPLDDAIALTIIVSDDGGDGGSGGGQGGSGGGVTVAAPSADEDSSCSVAAPGNGRSARLWWIALGVAVGWRRRRRRDC